MSKDLYVKHIADETSEEELRKLFAVCGKVTYVHMVKDAKSGRFVGCAYVKMSTEAEARDAIVTLDGARLGNREIIVVAALPQRPAGAPKPPARAGTRPGPPRGPAREGSAPGARDTRRPSGKGPQRPAGGNRSGGTPRGGGGRGK